MSGVLSFTVTGVPAPQGSKRGFYNAGLGRVQMVESSKKVAPWRQDVTAAAEAALIAAAWATPAGPVIVEIDFWLARPRSHYRTGRYAHLLRPDAPELVATKPDLDKLARSTLDALTSSRVIRDDAQVARLVLSKGYTEAATGAHIWVEVVAPQAAGSSSQGEGGGDPAHPATVQEALLMSAIPCKRPRVTIEPHPNGQPDARVVCCHVPRCGFQYPQDLQFVALISDANDQAARHRRGHRAAVPETKVVYDVEWDVHCTPCGGHRRTFGTRTDAEAWLAYHLSVEHGLVTC